MIPLVAAAGARLLPVRRFLARVPTWAWVVLGIALCGLVVARWHSVQVKAFGSARYDEGYSAARDDARKIQEALARRHAAIASKLRSQVNEALAANSRAADAVRLRGPGKAACPRIGGPSPASGGSQPAAAETGAAVAELHGGQWEPLVGLRFAPAVAVFEQHDALLVEVASWRNWYQVFSAEWEAAKTARTDAR